MTTRVSTEQEPAAEPQRQDDQRRLVEQASVMPGVAEAMAAYARLSAYAGLPVRENVVKHQVASGGNA